MHIDIPKGVRDIICELEKNGYEAYAVGGCVRDSILGRIPEDWDITTSAHPIDIKRCFHRTVDTGIKHGTVTVLRDGAAFEVTTYRIDGEYKDKRHPSEVIFTEALKEDLRRRDFTINAMAYNPAVGLVDIFGGREDLDNGLIRCVGLPDERFNEDALRILRAVRFAAQLGFEIENETSRSIIRHVSDLEAVSKERILAELTKLICSEHIEKAEKLFELGMAKHISKGFPLINLDNLKELKAHAKEVQIKLKEALTGPFSGMETEAFCLNEITGHEKRYIRFAMLCEGMEPVKLKQMLKELKADNDTIKNSGVLSEYVFRPLSPDRYELKSFMSGMERSLFYELLFLKSASRHTSIYKAHCMEEDIGLVIETAKDIAANNEAVYLSELSVSGADIKAYGIDEGPEIGKTLKKLLDMVHRYPEKNNKETLIGSLK